MKTFFVSHEDSALADIPVAKLIQEVERRLDIIGGDITMGDSILDFSDVPDRQLLHHIGIALEKA